MSAPTSLPIEQARPALLHALQGDAPVVIAAPTGSGKSTQLPGWLADALPGTVLVVEPRRVACRALATWVARQRDGQLGDEVGYRVRFDDRSGNRTRVLFVTPGVALNLWGSAAARDISAVIVDEFHERSWEIDLMVALVRRARARGSSVRLLLCSATLDVEALERGLDATVVQAQGRRFDVEIEHRGEGIPSPRDLEDRVASAVEATLRDGPAGDVLVFLPGKGEIERCGRALHGQSVTVCPVHGGLPPAALMRAFARASGRRVFLATNVAETSLTLPGVTTVIDSGLVRRRQHQAGRSVLALVPVSQASMDQRAGRAGRVAPGRCVRLWAERFAADPITPPEIMRVELDDMVLRAAQAGMPAPDLADAPWVDPPPVFALASAIDRLQATGALDEGGRMTESGRVRARLPVSAFSARILASPPRALAGLVADVVALVEVGRDLVLPGAHGAAVTQARRETYQRAVDEVEVQWLALQGGRTRAEALHPSALAEARALAGSLRSAVGAPSSGPTSFDRDALVDHLLARIPEAAFVPRPRSKPKGRGRAGGAGDSPRAIPWGNGEIEVLVRPVVIPGLESDEQPSAPKAGIMLDLMWMGHGRSAQGRGRLLLRCRQAQLRAAGLGETIIGPPILERRPGGRRVVADVEQRLGGVVIHSDREPLHGAPLCDAIAELVLQGRLRRELGERLRDDLHVLGLVEQDGEGTAAEVPTPREYLGQRLETAGLTELAELALLDADDLLPDIDARALERGIGARALRSLREDFPRRFAFEGNVYDCEVQLRARRVTLRAHRIDGKGGGEPPVRVLPRYRGFSVEYCKASRRLRLR